MKSDNIVGKILIFVVIIVECILGLRLVARLLGASSSGIFKWIYDISDDLMSPFKGLGNTVFGDKFVIEWSTLLAMIAYFIIVMIVVKMIDYVSNMMGAK